MPILNQTKQNNQLIYVKLINSMLMLCPIFFLALFPSVHRREQRNLEAAQSIIHGSIDESGVRPSTPGPSQSTSSD